MSARRVETVRLLAEVEERSEQRMCIIETGKGNRIMWNWNENIAGNTSM